MNLGESIERARRREEIEGGELCGLLLEDLTAQKGDAAARKDMQDLIMLAFAEREHEHYECDTQTRELVLEIAASITATIEEHFPALTPRADSRYSPELVRFLGKLGSGSAPKVIRLPGGKLGDVLRVLITRRAYERTVAPVIADAQHEYVEAVATGNDLRAKWIAVRLYIIIWPGWVYALFASMIRRIIGAGTGG